MQISTNQKTSVIMMGCVFCIAVEMARLKGLAWSLTGKSTDGTELV